MPLINSELRIEELLMVISNLKILKVEKEKQNYKSVTVPINLKNLKIDMRSQILMIFILRDRWYSITVILSCVN